MGSVTLIPSRRDPSAPVCELTVGDEGFRIRQDPVTGRYYVYSVTPRGERIAGAHKEGVKLMAKAYDLLGEVVA